jgi:hypothetical protein
MTQVVEFDKYPVDVQDLQKNHHQFRGIYGIIYLKLIKKSRKVASC